MLLLTIEGSAIVGRNGLAIIDRNTVQWWYKEDKSFVANISEDKPSESKE